MSRSVKKSTEHAWQVKELMKEKRELTESLQVKVKEVKKTLEDTFSLHDIIKERQAVIASLQS